MRALMLSHRELTREALLRKAEEMPGAWAGIRIAAFLLVLAGWKSTQIAGLFGLSRWSAVKLIRKANRDGLKAIEDLQRPGRPSRFDEKVLKELDEALSKPPQHYGLSGNRWGGAEVVEYLKRFHYIEVQVRHAQRIMKKLGHSLQKS